MHFPFHFRYQPIASGKEFTEVGWETPKVYFDCKSRDLAEYANGGKRARDMNSLKPKYEAQEILEKIPNGRLEEREQILYTTLGMTISAFLLLSKTLISKASTPINK